jgi:hypothetical protein
VAIHSLDGNRELSWTASTATGKKMWLKDPDMLPAKVKNARILTYGYNAATWGSLPQLAVHTMHDHAESLIMKVMEYRAVTNTPEVWGKRLR